MTTVASPPALPQEQHVAKRRADGDKPGVGRPAIGRQIGVRLGLELQTALEEIAEGMGLDLSSVMRMILTEQHGAYLERVRRRKQDAASEG